MNPEVLAVIRHIITTVGGGWMAKAGLEGSEIELLAGAVTTLIGLGWSLYDKRQRRKAAEAVAVAAAAAPLPPLVKE